jgi:hypothetical protein
MPAIISEPGESGGLSGRTGVNPPPPTPPAGGGPRGTTPAALSVRISRRLLLAASLLPAPKSSRRV